MKAEDVPPGLIYAFGAATDGWLSGNDIAAGLAAAITLYEQSRTVSKPEPLWTRCEAQLAEGLRCDLYASHFPETDHMLTAPNGSRVTW